MKFRKPNGLSLIAYVLAVFALSSCKKEFVTPTVVTTTIHDISYTSAKSGGEVTDNGGAPVTVKGICWGTSQKPTLADNFTSEGAGSNRFESIMTSLTPGVTYHVRAYATNSVGTSYGNEYSFKTNVIELAVLTTAEVTSITAGSAASGGEITNDKGGVITARGVCWNTTENPTIANEKTIDGEGSGSFVSKLTNLSAGTTYFVRAYATNSAGTVYGNQRSFTTGAGTVPVITTKEVSGLTSGGNVSDNGGSPITANGICWGVTQNPTLVNNFTRDAVAADFTSTLNGLIAGTTYYIRAYATNGVGTSYGNQITFKAPLTDIEGNIYKVAKIGTQLWMAENLRTTHYNDNSAIPNVTDNTAWIGLTSAAYSFYNNDATNKNTFGALYNWYTASSNKLCPQGWHVPSDEDFRNLELHLGIPSEEIFAYGFRGTDQGTQMKSTTTWNEGGNGTNSSGFNAISAGYRQWTGGEFWGSGTFTYFWTTTDDAVNGHPEVAWYRRLDYNDPRIFKGTTLKVGGKYIRCLKN